MKTPDYKCVGIDTITSSLQEKPPGTSTSTGTQTSSVPPSDSNNDRDHISIDALTNELLELRAQLEEERLVNAELLRANEDLELERTLLSETVTPMLASVRKTLHDPSPSPISQNVPLVEHRIDQTDIPVPLLDLPISTFTHEDRVARVPHFREKFLDLQKIADKYLAHLVEKDRRTPRKTKFRGDEHP
jgi:hypothetical protein